MKKRFISMWLLFSLLLTACLPTDVSVDEMPDETADTTLDPDGYYSTKEEVALYLHTYEELPYNYLTKEEARALGWEASEGNLWEVTDEYLIGGDRFGNREGLLPEDSDRHYYEADVNYEGGYRGPERLVYSNDGLIYYTDDHYDSFTLLYGED